MVLRGNGNGSLLSLACLIIFVCLYIYLQFSGRPQQKFLEEVFNQTFAVLWQELLWSPWLRPQQMFLEEAFNKIS